MTRKPRKNKEHGLKHTSYFFTLLGITLIYILSLIPEKNIDKLYRFVDKAYRLIGGRTS